VNPQLNKFLLQH